MVAPVVAHTTVVVVRKVGVFRILVVIVLCLFLMWRYFIFPAIDSVTPWEGVAPSFPDLTPWDGITPWEGAVPGSCSTTPTPPTVRPAGWTGMVNDAGLTLHRVAQGPPTPAEMVGWFGTAGREAKAVKVAFDAGVAGQRLLPLAPTPGPPVAQQVAACPTPDAGGSGLTYAGYSNGQVPGEALASLTFSTVRLQPAAAAALEQLNVAYAGRFGRPLSVTDGYRSLDGQVALRRSKPTLAAKPGKSQHGWGVAVDLGGGVQRFGTTEHEWMRQNGPRYGWQHPGWAQQGGSKPEPWHWEWAGPAQAAG